MPIVAADLNAYQSAVMPEDDTTGSVGGAIATAGRVKPMPWPATEAPVVRSDNAADTMVATVGGLDGAGALVEDTRSLAGVAPQTYPTSFSRILKLVLASAAAGTVTWYRNDNSTVVQSLAPGETSNRAMFYDAASAASQVIRYEKLFWQNDHGTLTLNSAELELTADPQARIRVGDENTPDDTTTNRVTAPSGVTFVNDSVVIDITSLAAGANNGLWAELDLPADDPAFNSSFTTQLNGTTAA